MAWTMRDREALQSCFILQYLVEVSTATNIKISQLKFFLLPVINWVPVFRGTAGFFGLFVDGGAVRVNADLFCQPSYLDARSDTLHDSRIPEILPPSPGPEREQLE
jgi:hypothetical protein